jgi:hypothetical protein
MLTAEQKEFYYSFGFLVLRQLFTDDEAATMKRESEEIYAELFGGKPSDATERMPLQPFFERRPFLAALPDDDRIYSIGEDLLGPDFALDGTEGNFHVGDTAWHGGRGEPITVRTTKIAFYLEPVTKETGCLRFIPGSHLPEFGEKLKVLERQHDDPTDQPFGLGGAELPSVAIDSQPGDVVVFMENTYHGAFGGSPGRQQHAISFFENPKTKDQEAWVRDLYGRARFSFRPSESYINSDRPRIRRIVSKLLEMGFDSLPY